MLNADYHAPNSGAPLSAGFWSVHPANYLNTINAPNSSGYIVTLNATTLVTQTWVIGTSSTYGTKSYFHK
jgi:hypothetical protein